MPVVLLYELESFLCQDPCRTRGVNTELSHGMTMSAMLAAYRCIEVFNIPCLFGSASNSVLLRYEPWPWVHHCRPFLLWQWPHKGCFREIMLGSASCINCSAVCSGQTFQQWWSGQKKKKSGQTRPGNGCGHWRTTSYSTFMNMGNKVTYISHQYPVSPISQISCKNIFTAYYTSCLILPTEFWH